MAARRHFQQPNDIAFGESQLDSFGIMFARLILRPSALYRRLRALSSHPSAPSDAHLGWTALGLPPSLARAHPSFRPQLHPAPAL